MEPGLAFTLCGLGICFLIPAFILGFVNRSKTTRCTVTTVATVKDILAKNSGDSLSFYPLYEYEVNNVLYTNTGAYLSHHVPQKGQKSRYDIIQIIQRSRIFRATIPKYISY